MDKNVILARLTAGETLQSIGDEFAAMMNAAAEEYNEAKRQEAETAAAKAAAEAKLNAEKHSLAADLIAVVEKYCAVSGIDPTSLGEINADEIDMIVGALDELMDLLRISQELKDKLAAAATPVMPQGLMPRIIPLELNDMDILDAFKATL